MKNSSIDNVLAIPTLVVSLFSCYCNLYVFISASLLLHNIESRSGKNGNNRNKVTDSNDFVIIKLIKSLALIDFLELIIYGSNTVPVTFSIPFFTNPICLIIGILNQFVGILGALWHIFIAVYLLYILTNGKFFNILCCCCYCCYKLFSQRSRYIGDSSHDKIHNSSDTKIHVPRHNFSEIEKIPSESNIFQNKRSYYRIITFILVFTTITTVIPLFVNGNHYEIYYNYYDKNGIGYGKECWIKDNFSLILFGIVIFSLIFHFTVLIFALIKYYQTRLFTQAYWYLINRLIPWVVVYSIIRIIPTVCKVWEVMQPKTVPLWLVIGHNCGVASLGIANALVWYFNRRVNPLAVKEKPQKKSQSGVAAGLLHNPGGMNVQHLDNAFKDTDQASHNWKFTTLSNENDNVFASPNAPL